jgi:hypothetical protein
MEERTIISFDYAVKYVLRDKADFGILSGFLSELLGRKVVVDAILESESNKFDPKDKTNRVDLKARIDGGELAVFEFQFHQEIDFFCRVLYGVSKAIVEQVSAGDLYGIKKVYSINVAYYNLGAVREYLFCGKFGGFKGVNFKDEMIPFSQTSGIESDAEQNVDIHPDYYLILPNMFDEQLRSRFDEWVYVLKRSAVRSDFTADGIAEAKTKLDLLQMSPDERKRYQTYLENKSSLDCALYTSVLKGRAEGKAEGLAEGKAEGLAEGRAEEKIEIALAMKAEGIDPSTISKITKLTTDEIARI